VSRRGAATLSAGLLLLCAAAFGVPALLVPGLAIVAVLSAAPAYVSLAGRRLELIRAQTSLTATEGERLVLAVRASGRGRRLRGGEVAPQPGAPFEPRRWLEHDVLRFSVTVGRRGTHEFGPSVLRVRDPFGLCESRTESRPTRVLALPRTERVDRAAVRRLRSAGNAATPGSAARVCWSATSRRRGRSTDAWRAGRAFTRDLRRSTGAARSRGGRSRARRS